MTEPILTDGVLIAQAQPQAQPRETLFTTQTPTNANANDEVSYELGLKFQSTKAGTITAIRHWKAASETGTHVGRIWSSTGSVLATVTFSNETASGWQEQALSTPLNIQANTTYIVTVNINNYFPITYDTLATSIVNQDLKSVADGKNGVFARILNTFPTNSYRNSNYFRDIVFLRNVLTLTKVSGDNQIGTAGIALSNPLVVKVQDSAGNLQQGVTVNFAVTNGGGSVSPISAVTGTNGQASTVLKLGTTAGVTNTVTATVSGIGSVTFNAIATPKNPNPIYQENQQPGTTNWNIPCNNFATQEILGYAVATSVNKGQPLDIKVSVAQPANFTVDVYRLGYYGGQGGRLLHTSPLVSGITQPQCNYDSTTNLVECSNWSISYTIPVGTNWTSGLYIAILTDKGSGKQSEIWFVVRDDSSTSDILFEAPFNTYLAYSRQGGFSLYGFNSVNKNKAVKVSYDRPFSQTNASDTPYDTIIRWERLMVRWLESQSYSVSYTTNVDVMARPQLLLQHKVFMSVAHNEYWSLEERNAVEQARDAKTSPVNLAFFSANTCYWRVRFENSSTGQPNRVMVCYKDTTDPVAPTNKFRSPQNNRPENALQGVMYTGDNSSGLYKTGDLCNPTFSGYDFVVSNSSDPYFANTGLKNGDTLSFLVGFEWDSVVANGFSPAGLVTLATSPVVATTRDADVPPTDVSNTVRYQAASGAKVFATGSIHWMWGLDSNGISPSKEDIRAKQIAVNALADMGAKPQTPAAGIVVP